MISIFSKIRGEYMIILAAKKEIVMIGKNLKIRREYILKKILTNKNKKIIIDLEIKNEVIF